MHAITTPPVRPQITPTPRLPPFRFDEADVPEQWFAGDVGTTASWNALGVMAGTMELQFIEAGRWLLDRITDPEIAELTRRFIRQESYHSTVHARFDRVLARRGLPVAPVRERLLQLNADIKRRAGQRVWLAMALAGEQIIGEMGHAGLAHPDTMDGAAELPRALWMWHMFEEVEHQSALHDGWVAVFGDDRPARDLRVLGAAYAVLMVGVLWPLLALAMVPRAHRRRRFDPRLWARHLRQLLGRRGLFRGVASNLWAVARVGFHPTDNHDPQPTLDAWRAEVTDESWARPFKGSARHGRLAGQPVRRGVSLRDLGNLALFAVDLARAGWALRRDVRAAGAPAAR